MEKHPLGAMLVEAGIITAQDLRVALESQRNEPAPLGTTLVRLGIALEEEILPILARQLNRIDVALEEKDIPAATSLSEALEQLLVEAIQAGSTDVHFEPVQEDAKIRVRIDGILREMELPALMKGQYPATVSRIKILCNLDIAEKRMPQEGRTTIRARDRQMDLRVSILPSRYGESVVIRVLDTEIPLGLPSLGMDREMLDCLEKILTRRSGLILVTGPTGCGKTTTLYACLDRLNDSTRKIVTIEDPIEYTLSGAIQMQVMAQIDLSFGRLLRTVLRHDPNIIMVGEIRDQETAEIAIRTALTGHLVLSTLHTNDAASTVTRLMEMGIEPYLVSSALSCIIAQRLVRTLCSRCAGKGCLVCLGQGLKGRTGIFEFLSVDEAVRDLILKQASVEEIRQCARARGMTALYDNGLSKVHADITTQEELDRVIHQDELM